MSLPKGFRDIEPEVARVRNRVVEELRRTYELFGFDPLDTPAVEYWETLAGKYGEEAESKLVWRFVDPLSKREYALRYDLTVPLARYVSSHPELPLPFKRYQIGLVWRHEEPQRMRYREFMQSDADIVGSPYVEADAEVVNVTLKGLLNAGVRDAFVRINHRKLVYRVYQKELLLDDPLPVLRAVDKLDKLGTEGLESELARLGLAEAAIKKVLEYVQVRGRWSEVEGDVRRMAGQEGAQLVEELSQLFSLILDGGRASVFDFSMVRGLDYYTGPIFEFGSASSPTPSLGGGGRYDGLIGMLSGKQSLPATGASIGVDRVVELLMREGSHALRGAGVRVHVVYLKRELYPLAWRVSMELREMGVPAEVDLMRRSEAKQRKSALSRGATHILFVGEREAASSTYTLYSVSTGERVSGSLEELAARLLRGG